MVVLTNGDEEELGLLALQAGAVGFLSKDAGIDALPRVLHAVRAGEGAISRTMTRRLVGHFRTAQSGASGLRPVKSPLTPREWEVIDLLAPGRSPEEVADMLALSTETVRSHVKNIMRKLAVHSRADALAAAERLRAAPASAAGPDVPSTQRRNEPGYRNTRASYPAPTIVSTTA